MKAARHLLLAAGLLLPLAGLAQDARQLSGAGQAWNDWSSANRRGLAEATRAQGGGQPATGALGPVRGDPVSGIAAAIAKGLGAATGAATGDDAGKQLDELARLLGRNGVPQGRAAVERVRRALESTGLLDPADGDSQPRVPSGAPAVPSACEGNPACTACYGQATTDLDTTRIRLEKLRALYSSTYRYGKNMIAFADGVSAVHGVAALAWQTRKVDVLKSLKNLDRAYDAKYEELIRQLHADLQGYGRCEAEQAQVPDWFDRFGFMYYQFMKTTYTRPSL